MKYFFVFLFLFVANTMALGDEQKSESETRPNILWLSAEDISPHLGCYGDPHAITEHLDQLAQQGVRYAHAYTTAGVCAPCRSGIITGMYQTSIGTQHMRCQAMLPELIKPFPLYLRQAGYFCTNNSKTDYQFKAPQETWDESSGKAHWRHRSQANQPFFAVFNFTGCHESGIASEAKYREVTSKLADNQRQDAAALTTLPPYYPDTAITREDWKRNYELITAMDLWAGDLIQQLKDDGLYEDTIIFFWSDHGVGLPRAKRWLYESGTHIPLIVRIPEKYRRENQATAGSVSDELVSSIDLGPTVLNLAGAEIPAYIQGRAFLGDRLTKPREYVFGARDRMDERYDIIRMVRDQRFRYIRNYEPRKTYYQYMNTAEEGATMQELRRVAQRGELPPAAALFMSKQKPKEELYDVAADPHEVHNLAADPEYQQVLQRMRAAHLRWVQETKDLGLIPESVIEQREAELGSRFAILRQENGDELNRRLAEVANLASADLAGLPELESYLTDTDEIIRYWAATGIGNLADEGIDASDVERVVKQLTLALQDQSATVRVAAAFALGRLNDTASALPVLIQALKSDQQWVRLQAAIALDELDEAARPAHDALQTALTKQPNKYIVRVANRALNQLDGTNRQVP
jgi:uncharacterized sulfatase